MEEREQHRDGAMLPPIGGGEGRLADNIVFFARALRRAGIKIGPGAIADAIDAVALIGIGDRDAFYAALQCVFVKRHEDQPVFDEAFRLFWRSRGLVEKMIAMPRFFAARARSSPVRWLESR